MPTLYGQSVELIRWAILAMSKIKHIFVPIVSIRSCDVTFLIIPQLIYIKLEGCFRCRITRIISHVGRLAESVKKAQKKLYLTWARPTLIIREDHLPNYKSDQSMCIFRVYSFLVYIV